MKYIIQKIKNATKDSVEMVNYLISEEEKAIRDYNYAISITNDANEIELYEHILQEEIEHLNELRKLKEKLTIF